MTNAFAPFPPPLRIAVLASGEGHTLQALLDACRTGDVHGEVVLLLSNNRESGAMRRAAAAGVPAEHLSGTTHADVDALDAALTAALQARAPDVVVLAGYMRKLGPQLLDAFSGAIINTHPSLLPRFGGKGMYDLHVHTAVLAAGETESGATVHLVEGDYDSGRILAQVRVPVLPGDDVEALAQRVKLAERPLLIAVLNDRAAKGRFGMAGAA